jgi:hypothetical protein
MFCPENEWCNIIIYFAISVFISRQIPLLFLTFFYVLFCGIDTITQQINIISIDQYLICPVQFQTDFIFLDFPNGIIQRKVEKQWRSSISLFYVILIRKYITQSLPTRTLLEVWFKHILYRLNTFLGVPNSGRML